MNPKWYRRVAEQGHSRGHGVYSASDPPRDPIKVCHTCHGMPWARRPDRENRVQSGIDVPAGVATIHGWQCSGCGEPYAEEPAVKRSAVLRSNGGYDTAL